jgi:hypothetical protein
MRRNARPRWRRSRRRRRHNVAGLDSLLARGLISGKAADGLLQRIADVPGYRGQQPLLGPEVGRGGVGTSTGASGGKVVAPPSRGQLLIESNNLTNQISDLLALGSARTVKQSAQLRQLRARADEVDALLDRGGEPTAMPGSMTPDVRQEIRNLPVEWTSAPLRKIED